MNQLWLALDVLTFEVLNLVQRKYQDANTNTMNLVRAIGGKTMAMIMVIISSCSTVL